MVVFFFLLWSTDVGLQLARRLSHRVPRGQLLLAAPKDSLERYHKHNNCDEHRAVVHSRGIVPGDFNLRI